MIADQTFRTATVNGNLNPVFNESFDLIIFDKALQVVELTIYDRSEIAQYKTVRPNSNVVLCTQRDCVGRNTRTRFSESQGCS